MIEAQSIKAMKYLEPSNLSKLARRAEITLEGKGLLAESIAKALRKDSPWNPVRPSPVGDRRSCTQLSLMKGMSTKTLENGLLTKS